ncbi:hypothetical protein KEM54_001564 [Ascosphaera aggregata]|nr:hypothetical protein KEM54_001564 [Ascosphaera aggregata]
MDRGDIFSMENLSKLPTDIKQWSSDLADSFDHSIDRFAWKIKDVLLNQEWIPDTLRSGNFRPFSQIHTQQNRTFINSLYDWCMEHQAYPAAVAAFVLTGVVMVYGNQILFRSRKRKARRAGNGARKEIVIVAGSPHDVMTRMIALDLDRRGFIVFVTTASVTEERLVRGENREDIIPLTIDLTYTDRDQSEIHPSLQHIHSLITQPQSPVPGVPPHLCQLSGLIVIPHPACPSGPVSAISASSWTNAINSRIVTPILITRLVLPLLAINKHSSSIVILSPSLQESVSAPFAGPEVTTAGGLSSFAKSLRNELRFLRSENPIDVTELKLGNINLGPRHRFNSARTGEEPLPSNSQQLAMYGDSYLRCIDYQPGRSEDSRTSGSNVRELHFAIFDAMLPAPRSIFGWKKRRPRIVYVGRGARAYAVIGGCLDYEQEDASLTHAKEPEWLQVLPTDEPWCGQ